MKFEINVSIIVKHKKQFMAYILIQIPDIGTTIFYIPLNRKFKNNFSYLYTYEYIV